MGQALRRAMGAVRLGRPDPPPHRQVRPAVEPHPPPPTASSKGGQDRVGVPGEEVTVATKAESGVLEERDPKYDELLRHMVGRISSRPLGKQEMDEAAIVKISGRAMPKLRSSREGAGAGGQKPLPPGTISVEQIRQILLLHQGKAECHPGPMDTQDIAKKFGVDVAHVQQIIQFMSLPPDDENKKPQE